MSEPARDGAPPLAALSFLVSWLSRRPATLGLHGDRLADCPASPNCVCSEASDAEHRIAPLELAVEPVQAWEELGRVVSALPRTRVVTRTESYLHAEVRSRFFGFVDDLELQLRPAEQRIAVRSASRLGHSDLGVNRRCVEALRSTLRERGVLRDPVSPADAP